MFARFGQDANQQINDFIGAVAHGYPARVHPVQSGQGVDQTWIAALGIAEQKRRVATHGFLGQGRSPQRVFIAGHFDDLGKAVFLLDFRYGKPRHVGVELPDVAAHADFGHGHPKKSRRWRGGWQALRGGGKRSPSPSRRIIPRWVLRDGWSARACRHS